MAKIKTTQELIDTITDLTTEISVPDGSFTQKMSSTDANTVFTAIQNTFDRIYEKLRELEDLHDFAEQYIQTQFTTNERAIQDAIKIIDNVSDLYQDTKNTSQSVSFQSGVLLQDRDGSPIDTADSIDGILLPNHVDLSIATLASVTVRSNDIPYRQQKNPPDKYRSFYALETPAADGVQEEIRIMFPRKTEVNFVRFSVFNGSVLSTAIIREDDEIIPIENKDLSISTIKAKGIIFKLKSTSVQPVNTIISDLTDKFAETKETYNSNLLNTIFETISKQKGDLINGIY